MTTFQRVLGLCTTCVVLTTCGVDQPADVEGSEAAASIVSQFWDRNPAIRGCAPVSQQCTVDGITVHCCPSRNAMLGANFGLDEFRCGQLFLDPALERCTAGSWQVTFGGIKFNVCPAGKYMKGHHAGQNKSICCDFLPGHRGLQRVDGASGPGYLEPGLPYPSPFGSCPSIKGHSCFANEVLVGKSPDNNYFICETT